MLQNTKKGFTLIELLVVIAIIAILAAILFPVFARARENARRSSCSSNIKQIGLGFQQYIQDYDEKYPLIASGGVNSGGWAIQMQPYLKSTQIFQCPSEPTAPASVNSSVTTGTNAYGNTGFTDYWYNARLNNKSQAAVDQVSSTIINGDGTSSTASYAFDGQTIDDTAAAFTAPTVVTTGTGTKVTIPTGNGDFGLRHLDGLNYGFADGHVKWLKSGDKTSLNKVFQSTTPYSISNNDPTFYAGS